MVMCHNLWISQVQWIKDDYRAWKALRMLEPRVSSACVHDTLTSTSPGLTPCSSCTMMLSTFHSDSDTSPSPLPSLISPPSTSLYSHEDLLFYMSIFIIKTQLFIIISA